MKTYKKYLPSFVIYFIIGVVAFIIAGLTLRQIIGFGVIFGFVAGLLNEVHRDLVGDVGKIEETVEPIKKEENKPNINAGDKTYKPHPEINRIIRDDQVQGM